MKSISATEQAVDIAKDRGVTMRIRHSFVGLIVTALLVGICSGVVDAHGVSGKDAVFLQGLQGRAIGPLMYLGAKHMVTGYDHLLFVLGVIFFRN